MNSTTENIEPIGSKLMLPPKKASASLLIVLLVILALTASIDQMAHETINQSVSSALITFGTASLLDSMISTFKSVELSIGFASLDIGQMLNSTSDMLDLFKHTMALALASLSLQKFLLVVMSSKLFNVLIAISGGLLLSSLWVASLSSYKHRATQVFKVLVIIRFSVITSVSLSLGADYLFIDKSITENESQATELSQTISQKMDVLISMPESELTDEEEAGFMSSVSEKWNNVKSTVLGPAEIVTDVLEFIDDAMIKFINLMMLFVLKTIILPLLFLLAFKKFVIEAF